MKKPLMLLIDGTNLTHAIYHATRGATIADQMRCLRSRVAALRTLSPKPTHAAIAFDSPGPNWRRELYPDYKAGRADRDPELAELLAASVLDDFSGIDETLFCPGVEADDLIATRWQHTVDVGGRVLIVSADRDLWQLLQPGACSQLMRFKTSAGKVTSAQWQTHSEFVNDYGFEPTRWPLYKAIAGDKSDAIAGMAGLGDTAARAICKRYASFDEALADRWKTPLSPRQFATFEAAVRDGSAVRDQKLCTLVFDVDIENGSEPLGMETANAYRSNDR